MLIHVRKIFNCKALFQIPLSKCLLNFCKRTLNIAVIKWFQNGTIGENTRIVIEIVLIQLFSYRCFYTKNKNENPEYCGIFISFKSQLYSKQGSSIFLLFDS